MPTGDEIAEASEAPRTVLWGFWGTLIWGMAILVVVNLLQTVGVFAVMVWRDGDAWTAAGSDPVHRLIETASSGLGISVSTIIAIIAYGAPVAGVIRLKKGAVLRAYLGLEPVSLARLRNWLGLLVGLLIVIELLGSALGRSSVSDFMTVAYATASPVWLLWLAVVIAAPVSEELFFRGFLLKGFAASFMGPIAAIMVTSAAWTALHIQYDAYDMATIFVSGLLFGAARLMTGSLLVPLALHGATNLVAITEVAFLG